MNPIIFAQIVSSTCDYYEKKQFPKDDTMKLWAQKVSGIPDEAARFIESHVTDGEIFPRNFPSTMWALFYSWQQANPDKKAEQRFFECPDCHEGLIWAAKQKEGTGPVYKSVFRCCRCRQNLVQAYPESYKADLIRRGYEIRTPQGFSGTPREERAETLQHMNRMGVHWDSIIHDSKQTKKEENKLNA